MKIVKGIGKAAKSVVSGVVKGFKKVMKSDIGKMLLLAAAVYTGGVALGAWGATGPLSFMHGSLAAGGAAGGGAAAGSSLTAGATGGAGITSSTLAGTSGIGAATNAAVAPVFQSGITAAAAPSAMAPAVQAAGKGIVGKAMGWAANNPIPAAMGLNAAATAMSPDEIDMARENERIRLEKYKNMATGDINVKPTDQPLNYQDGRPVYSRGIIQRGMA